MQGSLLIDISRLMGRTGNGRLPTGVDRVCLAYLSHFGSRAQAVLQSHGWRRIMPYRESQELFRLLLESGPHFLRDARWTLTRAYLPPWPSHAAIFEIFPSSADSSCNEEFENRANGLKPGDVLILHGGTYTQTCRRAITVNGTAGSPITIRAADGETPIVTRPQPADFNYDQNNIEIINSSFLVIRGLHFKGGDGGVSFVGGHHITFEANEIYETGNNALRMNSGNTDAFIIRGNHIHHTGLLAASVGTTEGEGMYVGCNNATCIASNHLIESNYIHHTRATSDGGNDGIEIKVGSFGNTVRNNVIHDTTSGKQFPCIFVYGGGSALNVVEGNAMWSCGEAIQVVSDAIVRNNLILNSGTGITAAPHAQVPQLRAEEALVLELLEKDDVLVHPGYFFDFDREAFVVVSLLVEPATFDQAVTRLLPRAAGAKS